MLQKSALKLAKKICFFVLCFLLCAGLVFSLLYDASHGPTPLQSWNVPDYKGTVRDSGMREMLPYRTHYVEVYKSEDTNSCVNTGDAILFASGCIRNPDCFIGILHIDSGVFEEEEMTERVDCTAVSVIEGPFQAGDPIRIYVDITVYGDGEPPHYFEIGQDYLVFLWRPGFHDSEDDPAGHFSYEQCFPFLVDLEAGTAVATHYIQSETLALDALLADVEDAIQVRRNFIASGGVSSYSTYMY